MQAQSNRKLSRRDFLKIASLTAGAGLLAACGAPQSAATEAASGAQPQATQPSVAKEPIQWWVGWGELVPFFDSFKTMPRFKELMGDYDVEMKPNVSNEALLTAIAAGTPPDIAANVPYYDLFAREVCVEISDWVAKSSIIRKEDYIEGNWSGGFYQGKMYGVPTLECFVRFGLNYNARMVEAAGLDPDKPPVTWDEALEWHRALTKFDSAGNLLQIGLDPYDAEGGGIGDGFFAARSWGFKWFDPDTGTFNLANDKMAESFEVMGEFYRIVGPDKMSGMRSVAGNDTWGGSYNAEVQAMIIEGYWHPGETMAQMPEVAKYNRATWSPVPESRRGVKFQGTGGHYNIFFRGAKNAEPAFRFAEFLNTDEVCDKMFKDLGWLPAYKPYLSKADPNAYPGLKWYFDSVTEATEIEHAIPCPILGFVDTTYAELREAVYRGQKTGQQAAEEFQQRCEAEYKNAGFAG